MLSHDLFYFPYASITEKQLSLARIAALYFDKLTILDPVGASWEGIGADAAAREALKLLRDEGILELVSPADVLAGHAHAIEAEVRRDMADVELLGLCEEHARATGKHRWTLSLAKVPMRVLEDASMRRLMGDVARELAATSAGYVEMSGGHPGEYLEYAASGQTYDGVRLGDAGETEYRYADLPLALGESIMVNHALFAGLHHTGAVPITDEPFHSRVLGHKLRRAAARPEIAEVIERRSGGMSAAALASTALSTLKLPILDVSVPLAEILEYRRKHADGLAALRERMTRLARQIDSEPWTTGFSRELEKRFLPDLADDLADARKARDAWLASSAKKAWYAAAGVAFGAASVALGLVAAPLTPIALAAAGVGVAGTVAIPGASWLSDWRDGKKAARENGLHYLLGEVAAG